ncbi:MAG: hypothetical protein ABW189_02725 [Rickettsiales bacterium]
MNNDGLLLYIPFAKILAFDPNLTFFPEARGVTQNPAAADCFIGWGRKASGLRSLKQAQKRGKQFWALEDAFLRSVGLGKNGAWPLGLIVDKTGVYYDCRSPSDLENRANAPFSTGEQERGVALVARIVSLGCTKYNVDVDPLPKEMRSGRHVLLIDQTEGDCSVGGAGGSEESFKAMLRAAVKEYPDATLWIKTHPDVLAGKARGYVLRLCEDRRRFTVIAGNPPSYRLAQAATAVFTVSSQFGFEALMAGAEVHCFAMPFYAGWGLTVDRGEATPSVTARRTARPSLAMLAHAAFIDGARYRHPFADRLIEAEEAVDMLYDIKNRYLSRPQRWCGVGFSGWKRPFVRRIIGSPFRDAAFYGSVKRAATAAREAGEDIVVWAGKEKGALAHDLRAFASDLKIWRAEDGFIRSPALGAALTPAHSLACDGLGAHFDASRPSDLENLLNGYVLSDAEKARASALFARLANESVTKYGVAGAGEAFARSGHGGSAAHLIVGQVADDASIRATPRGGIASNEALIAEIARLYPGEALFYRPHPDVTAGYRKGKVSPDFLSYHGVVEAKGHALGSLLRAVDHVHVMASLAGMEALYYGKRVHVYGAPFYAGWGLTRDRLSFPNRKRTLAPEELTYIALAIYPHYVDPVSFYPCDVETILDRFGAENARPFTKKRAGARWVRYVKGWRHCVKK